MNHWTGPPGNSRIPAGLIRPCVQIAWVLEHSKFSSVVDKLSKTFYCKAVICPKQYTVDVLVDVHQ